jgi:hypothetical protein
VSEAQKAAEPFAEIPIRSAKGKGFPLSRSRFALKGYTRSVRSRTQSRQPGRPVCGGT